MTSPCRVFRIEASEHLLERAGPPDKRFGEVAEETREGLEDRDHALEHSAPALQGDGIVELTGGQQCVVIGTDKDHELAIMLRSCRVMTFKKVLGDGAKLRSLFATE